MPERRLLEGHKSNTDDNQQSPWKVLIRIQDGACGTYVLQIQSCGLCARDQTSAYMATAAATPPFRQLLPQTVKTTFRSCGRRFPELVRSHHRGTYRSSLLAPSQMRRSVSEAGWQLLPPRNERNSRVVPTPQHGPPKKVVLYCVQDSSWSTRFGRRLRLSGRLC